MTAEDFNKLVKQLEAVADGIVAAKRPDYTQESDDVLQNFKDAAALAGITPLQAWMVHFQKQFSAIARYVKNPACKPSETIESRFADLRNYLHLGYGLVIDQGYEVELQHVAKAFQSYNDNRYTCTPTVIDDERGKQHQSINETTNIQG